MVTRVISSLYSFKAVQGFFYFRRQEALENFETDSFRSITAETMSADLKSIRTTGHGKSGFIKYQKYEYNIIVDVIGRKKPIKYIANELQSEYIRDEFARRGIYAIRNYCEKEKYL